MNDQGITHCLTIGRRPDLLRQTLLSLGSLRDLPTLAINDFGDAETDEVFRELCPQGRIVGPGHHLGHHKAIDAMYSEVTSPWIFHDEDDWLFTRQDFLTQALQLLVADPRIVSVCLRDTNDIPLSPSDRRRIVTEERAGIRFQRLDALHDQWHGFTFNPHLIRTATWREVGGYADFRKERHLSRMLRGQGRYVAFLLPGACNHNGDGRSLHARPPSRWKRFKRWVRQVKQVKDA